MLETDNLGVVGLSLTLYVIPVWSQYLYSLFFKYDLKTVERAVKLQMVHPSQLSSNYTTLKQGPISFGVMSQCYNVYVYLIIMAFKSLR